MQRSQSQRAKQAAAQCRSRRSNTWTAARSLRLLDDTRLDASWETLDSYAAKVNEQIDLLINYTAGDGFIYRQSARATVARDIRLNIAGTALALLLSGARRLGAGAPHRRSGRRRLERRRTHRHRQARRRHSARRRRRARRAAVVDGADARQHQGR